MKYVCSEFSEAILSGAMRVSCRWSRFAHGYAPQVYWLSNTKQLAGVDIVRYTRSMTRIIRSALLQMRVAPEIKLASEHVLRRIGLNLTEATELFLRRMIIDQRILRAQARPPRIVENEPKAH